MKKLYYKIRDFGKEEIDNYFLLIGLVIILGIISGFIGVLFKYLVELSKQFFFEGSKVTFNKFYPYYIPLIPAIGGILAGIIIFKYSPESRASGIPHVIASSEVGKGEIKPRVIWAKIVATSLSLGTGNSAGKEGPVTQVGAAIGSFLAKIFNLNVYTKKLLLACGAAGAISATFNAPLGGVLFAFELILREFKTKSFIPIVITSVLSTFISRYLMIKMHYETGFIFNIPAYSIKSPYELFFYLILGIVAGLFALLFINLLFDVNNLFKKLKVQNYIKPAIGGLLVGFLGLIMLIKFNKIYIFGVGYDIIEDILLGEANFILLLVILLFKFLATIFTVGSENAGGVFAPSLYIGAMIGAIIGIIAKYFFPEITSNYTSYAIVGMAAFYAGVSRATLTAILIIFEMTGTYNIIVPLMFACVMSDFVSALFSKYSVYTIMLKEHGVFVNQDMDVNFLKRLRVKDAMTKNFISINWDDSGESILLIIKKNGIESLPVMKNNICIGIITLTGLINKGLNSITILKAIDLIDKKPHYIDYNNSLENAVIKFRKKEIEVLIAIDSLNDSKIKGLLTKGDIIYAYRKKRYSEFITEKKARRKYNNILKMNTFSKLKKK